MTDQDYEAYTNACKSIRAENTKLLAEFQTWLTRNRLSQKTIRGHVENLKFYLNDYLLYEDALTAQEGVDQVSMFLGDWFFRKAMWASPSSIKENAASLKKFYTFMQERGRISAAALQDLKDTIKDEMPEWLETLDLYDDPDITDPGDVWGL